MWRLRLIRFRLTFTYTLLLTGVFVLFSVGLFVTLHRVLYDNFYSQVDAAADKVVKDSKVSVSLLSNYQVQLRVDSETVGGDLNPTTRLGFFNLNGQLLPGDKKGDPRLAANPAVKKAIEQASTQNSKQNVTVSSKNGDTNVLAVPVNTYAGPYVLLVQSSFQEVQRELELLQNILIVSALTVTLLSAGGSWFLTGRVLQPISQITEKVRKITAQDLSERLNIEPQDEIGRMAATFDTMIERLQASFERQKRFTADASHELRTPLAAMQADISLALRRQRSAPEYRTTLESAQEEVVRLSHIVNDLLLLARMDTDAAQVTHDPVALDEVLANVVSGLRPLAAERAIALTYFIDAPVTILGDETRLKQVFFNLLDNALAYTPNGGGVRIILSADAAAAEVSFSDSGIGIASADLPHIFERFFRAEDARVRNHEGSGLGLAIAQKAVQAHQGRIEVSSMVGQGSTFRVFLPLAGPLAGQGETSQLAGRFAHGI